MHSPKKWIRVEDCNLMALETCKRCWCLCSKTPFCCGVRTQLLEWITPLSRKNLVHDSLKNYDPLYVWMDLIFAPYCFETRLKNLLMCITTSNLCLIKNTQVTWEWSSTILRKYANPLWVTNLYGPQTSKCIKSDKHFDLLVLIGYANLLYLLDINNASIICLHLILLKGVWPKLLCQVTTSTEWFWANKVAFWCWGKPRFLPLFSRK